MWKLRLATNLTVTFESRFPSRCHAATEGALQSRVVLTGKINADLAPRSLSP